ncbi:MAG: chemotaxis protein CheW [Spirochaetota bacterium]|nr:chemotaxis protein CheW [Spirochaetota bacterium]
MAFTIGEYQDLFLEEADEQLQELNQNLLELEKNPHNEDTINNIFRTAHSLKSSAAFVGLNDLSDLAHKMENLLQGIRDGTMKVSIGIVDILFQCFDYISIIISAISEGREPTQDLTDIINKIQNYKEDNLDSVENTEYETTGKIEKKDKEDIKISFTPDERKNIKNGLESGHSCSEVALYIEPTAPMKWIKAQLAISNLERIGKVVKVIPSVQELDSEWEDGIFRVVLLTDQSIDDVRAACELDLINRIDMRRMSLSRKDNKLVLVFHNKESLLEVQDNDQDQDIDNDQDQDIEVKEPEKVEDLSHPKEISVSKNEKEASDSGDIIEKRVEDRRAPSLKIVKVSVEKLDLLLNNVGELVIANSGFYKLYEEMKAISGNKLFISEYKNRMDQMSRIAKDLQSGIMKTRMVQIGQVFSRFNRLVRDLAKEFNKQIRLDIKGEDTELDKKVVDAIGEPIMHLIRNSMDHGIEDAAERRKLGKSEEAVVTLNAYQGGNQIFIEVSDDGRGLDAKKIKNKAIEKGMATQEMLNNMDDEDIFNFIFAPGFSTSEVITDVSGRGVGMNVVKEIVNELNGNIRIETERGMGTVFILTFPLTLAITPAIMVKVSDEMYAIPLHDVIETIKISQSVITTIEGHEVINLRGEILSLIRLNEFINIKSSLENNSKMPVVVVGYGNRKVGVMVDYLEGKQEIVIKSLEENYTSIDGISGASILGDGSICLILDVQSMINMVISREEKLSRRTVIEAEEVEVEHIDLEEEKTSSKEITEPITFEEVQKDSDDHDVIEQPASTSEDNKPAQLSVEEEDNKLQKIDEVVIFEKDEIIESHEEGKASEHEKIIIFNEDSKELDSNANLSNADTSSSVSIVSDDDIEAKVQEALFDFREELKDNITTSMEDHDSLVQIFNNFQIEKADFDKVQMIANVGITNAAESLSIIIDKKVDLSIPEVRIIQLDNASHIIGEVDSVYIGVYMPFLGDIRGTVLFTLSSELGFELIDLLYETESSITKELNEDGESALKEITNIIGSSVINMIAEKTGYTIRTTVPTVIHDFMQSTLNSILIENNIANDYALLMDTEFFFQDDRVLGKILILSDSESLKNMLNGMKD